MDKEKKLNKVFMVISLILPFFIFLLLDLFYMIFCYNYTGIIAYVNTLTFSYFILYMVYLIFWGITKKSGVALTLLAVILFVFSIINQIKIAYTNEPVLFTDILFLNNTGELTGIIGSTVLKIIKYHLNTAIIYLKLNFLICTLSILCTIQIKKTKIRLIMILVPLAILTIIFLPLKSTTNFFLTTIFKTDKRVDYERYIYKTQYYAYYGVVSGMYNDLLENRLYEPENYNEKNVNETIKKAKNNSDNSFGKPNIIVLFAESFWDVDQLEEVSFNKEVTKNFNELKEKGIFINMISPSYGGVSSNIEFEFLTGANVMYFNEGYIPCMQLYRNKTYYDRPSIIKELRNNGYKTKIVNYTSPKSFQIGRFYKYLEVDEAEFILDTDKKYFKGQYVSDEYIIDKTIEEFNNKDKNEKLFYMTLTMQSHMPYLKEKYDNYDIKITKSNLSNDMNETLLSYSQGIYDADQQLKRLYDYIQTLDEPTIIVFYGDHLPYLKTTENVNILDYLNYFNTGNEKINLYRKYNTQCLILANFDVENDETNYLSPDLLGCYIINRMDINISGYYKWLYNNKYSLPSANWYISMDTEGNLYYTSELSGELKNAYDFRKNVQYKLFVK